MSPNSLCISTVYIGVRLYIVKFPLTLIILGICGIPIIDNSWNLILGKPGKVDPMYTKCVITYNKGLVILLIQQQA